MLLSNHAGYSIANKRLDIVVLLTSGFLLYVVGSVIYYGKLTAVYQLSYLGGPIILLACALRGGFRSTILTWPMRALVIWMLWLVVGSIGSGIPVEQMLLGLRIYAPVFFVALGISLWPNPIPLIQRLEKAAVWVPIVQMPFVLQQFFVVRAGRSAISWDSVVGTFGGDPLAGGDSPGLALAVTVATVIALYLRRHGRISRSLFWASIASSFLILIMSEVKLFLILLPVVLFLSVSHFIWRRPSVIVSFLVFTPIFVIILLSIYQNLYWGTTSSSSIEDSVSASFSYFFDEDGANYETGQVSRGASFALWSNDFASGADRKFAGYGMASTRFSSAVAVGEIGGRYYPLDVGATAVAQLLWDGGIVAAGLYILALLLGIARARRILLQLRDPLQRDRIAALRAILFSIVVMLFYNKSFVDLAFEQLLLGMTLGIVSSRHVWRKSESRLGLEVAEEINYALVSKAS